MRVGVCGCVVRVECCLEHTSYVALYWPVVLHELRDYTVRLEEKRVLRRTRRGSSRGLQHAADLERLADPIERCVGCPR